MQFFAYHRDRVGSTPLRGGMNGEHWSYMDRFELVARGPTFAEDDSLTGSVHVVDVPDAAAARAFAFDEPCYQAGAYRDVLLRRTDWARGPASGGGWLVLAFSAPAPYAGLRLAGDDLVGSGPLLSDDGTLLLGAAALTPSDEVARSVLDAEPWTGVEVHRWEPGGRR